VSVKKDVHDLLHHIARVLRETPGRIIARLLREGDTA
jgi:hypothetical protein